jgi:hypothetical protein
VCCAPCAVRCRRTGCRSTISDRSPTFSAADHALYARHALENPLVERYLRTQDGRSYRFSDVASADELHATELYREFYAPIGLEHQIAFTLPHTPQRVLGVALSRAHDDFSDAERDVLDAARPFLIQCYRNAIATPTCVGRPAVCRWETRSSRRC